MGPLRIVLRVGEKTVDGRNVDLDCGHSILDPVGKRRQPERKRCYVCVVMRHESFCGDRSLDTDFSSGFVCRACGPCNDPMVTTKKTCACCDQGLNRIGGVRYTAAMERRGLA